MREDQIKTSDEIESEKAVQWFVRGVVKWLFIATAIAAGVGIGLWLFT